MKITSWKLVITWEDGVEQELKNDIGDISGWLINKINKYLDELEEEYEN